MDGVAIWRILVSFTAKEISRGTFSGTHQDSHVVIMQPDWGFFAAATSVSTWGSSWAGLEEEEVEEELF